MSKEAVKCRDCGNIVYPQEQKHYIHMEAIFCSKECADRYFDYVYDDFPNVKKPDGEWVIPVSMELRKCPRCGKDYKEFPAISRLDDETEICSECGNAEGMFDYSISAVTNQDEKLFARMQHGKWLPPNKYKEYLEKIVLIHNNEKSLKNTH